MAPLTLERRPCPYCGRAIAVRRPIRHVEGSRVLHLPGWRLLTHTPYDDPSRRRGRCAGSSKIIPDDD